MPNNFLHIAAYHHNLEPIKHFKIRLNGELKMKKIVYGGIKGVFLNDLEYNKLTNLLKENKNLYEQLKKEMEMQQ